MPNTEIMIHELSSGSRGKATDLIIDLEQIKKMRDKMAEEYVKMTGQPLKKIRKDMERDFYMSAEEAVRYGLIDSVQSGRKGNKK